MSISAPFQLLELNVISAQDLEPVSRRKMRTYAVAWVHEKRKLSTRIDTQGHTNPTWNDKFVFRVNDEFLYGETSAVVIEIYAVHWFRDVHLGTVRAIVGNIIPSISWPHHRHEIQLGMRCVALQVWRQSGRPQGILNIGVALLDSSRRSMPLCYQMGSSAVGYQYLMGEEDSLQPSNINLLSSTSESNNKNDRLLLNGLIKPELRRTKSDSSSIFLSVLKPRGSLKGSSIINGGSVVYGGGSMVNGSEIEKNNYRINSRGSSMVNYIFERGNKKGKSNSIINKSDDPRKKFSEIVDQLKKTEKDTNNPKLGLKAPPGRLPGGFRFNGLDHGAPKTMNGPTIWNDLELGPSSSKLATAMAENMYLNRTNGAESSLVEGSSLDDSIEGLRSKLERWRTELTSAYQYDRGSAISGYVSSGIPSTINKPIHARRHTESGGLFSCFGNICGCEISITCGSGGAAAARKKGNLRGSPSVDNLSFL